MAKRLEEYVKYTQAELDSYVSTPGSCVHKINSNRHYALDPYVLINIKSALPAYILKYEISYYERKLQGVLLAVKNIKVLNGVAAIRADDPQLHIDINADCYVFRPEQGVELTGIVKHIGKHHVSVVLYRVFNANINFKQRIDKEQLTMGQELKFRVKNFGLNGMFINIHGELLTSSAHEDNSSTAQQGNKIIFHDDVPDNSATPDSGIEEEDKLIDLDALIESIKNEPLSDGESTDTSKSKQKVTKRKRKYEDSSNCAIEGVKIKKEPDNSEKKRVRKLSEPSASSVDVKTEHTKKIKNEKLD